MAAPVWLGASQGSAPQASQISQFLAAHAITNVYTGSQVAAQATPGAGAVNSNGLWLAQSFTTGSFTTTGRAVLTLALTGTPGVLTVGLYSNSSGAPGTALVTTALPKEFVAASAAAVSIPLPAAVTASATYWIVTQAAGDSGDYFAWSKSNQVSGASTSASGTSWAAQAYGLAYQVLDQSVTAGSLRHTWEDSGARWTALGYSAAGLVTRVSEYTAGQVSTGYTVTSRALSYSGGDLTGVA